ncbi:MipA family protein [Gammaproteobacteria bacterium]
MKCGVFLVILGLGLVTNALQAGDAGSGSGLKPLWEVGVGVSGLYFPDYRGSDQGSGYLMPIPYFVYRGDFFKADRNGIRGTLFDNDRLEFNMSLGASLPVNSNDNRARRGMPDLNLTLEIGPSLDIHLWRAADRRQRLDLRLPVRTAVTVGDKIEDIGQVFSPRLNLDLDDPAGLTGWHLGMLVGPLYGSARNHRYFYSVAPQYATADRPAYDADGGYAGTQCLLALSKRFPGFWIGAFARWDTLQNARFEDSPLVRSDHYFAAGVGFSWILGESTQRVETRD